MTRVAILISGGGSNMVALLDRLAGLDSGTAALVLSNNADAGGLAKAEARGVPVAVVDHRPFSGDREAFQEALNAALDVAGTELICLAGFMRILTPSFTARWTGRMINIHPSLLPKYPGLNTHQRALDAGDSEAGCSVHWVTEELDAGPLIGQARVPVAPADTATSLAARVLAAEHKLYPACLAHVLEKRPGMVTL